MVNKGLRYLKNVNKFNSNFSRKIKPPFMIYVDFEIVLVPENNRNQNPEESYTNKYQIHVACSYIVLVKNQFYLGQDAVYNFINTMIEESKYCTYVIKKPSAKNLR